MIVFSPAKINIGLQILEKRQDGFHNIRSVMYPTGLCDILEFNVLPAGSQDFQLSQSGIPVHTDPDNHLVTAAWRLLRNETALPPVAVHLHKQIPVGAGLGGGSSNASSVLRTLNQMAPKGVSAQRLEELASSLGSDCPFFLHQGAMLMEGRGEILSQVRVDLKGLFMVLLFPGIHVSSAEAYGAVRPALPDLSLEHLISLPVTEWPGLVINDFEKTVGARFPLIRKLKDALKQAGAVYASMSGSGSSLYGFFNRLPQWPGSLRQYVIWEGPA